jgi:hypothetical protein
MQTEIEYLKEFREDLLEAAWRESLGGRPKKTRRPMTRWPRRRLVALGVAASLVIAGGVGYVALRLTRDDAPSHTAYAFLPVISSRPHGPAAVPSPAPGPAGNSGDVFGVSPTDHGLVVSGSRPQEGPELARIIKTGSLEVVVGRGTFQDAYQRATSIASRYGGFVQSSSTSGSRSGTLLIRVPAARFESALGDLRALGHVSFQSVNGRDVTSQFIDLGARLQIARARRDALLTLMGKATTIGQTLQVQNVLDQTQLNIEELQRQLRHLGHQTTFATINMNMREKGVTVVKKKTTTAPIHNPSFTRGIKHAVAGFLGVLVATVVGLGYLVPIAVLALIIWFVVRRVRRTRTA